MRKLPPLKSLHAFEAAARLNSFVAASAELLITPSAVSHRIHELESFLGIQLFHRIHRTIVLTDAGQRFATEIGLALGKIEAIASEITRAGKSDLITVHVVPSLAAQWLMPRIVRFSTQYPDIDVRITASVEPVNLDEGKVDLAIHYGSTLRRAGTELEEFPPEPIVALCSPTFMKGKLALRTTKDLERYPLIHSEVNKYSWRDWQREHPEATLNLDRGLRFDRSFMAIFAAADGLGVCLESKLLVERQLDSGRLVLPFGDEGPRIQCHSMSYLKSRANLPKIKVFRNWILKSLNESPGLR